MPSKLGLDNLGWESSKTMNIGLDYGLFNNRITGYLNYYNTRTSDLLLDRTISAVHGITSITSNIGETQNRGVEFVFTSRNVVAEKFKWIMSVNFSMNKNKILSLYGELNDKGEEIDDVANAWFIGEPISVNYDYVWDGVWQLDEADQAAIYGSKPGWAKLKDVNDDGVLGPDDRQIIGQLDPKMLFGYDQYLLLRPLLPERIHSRAPGPDYHELPDERHGTGRRGQVQYDEEKLVVGNQSDQ